MKAKVRATTARKSKANSDKVEPSKILVPASRPLPLGSLRFIIEKDPISKCELCYPTLPPPKS